MDRFLAFLSLVLIILSVPQAAGKQDIGAVPCNEVVLELAPCISYVRGLELSPSKYCCDGVKYIYRQYGQTKEERESVCSCLESLLPLIGGAVDGSAISSLPRQCNLTIALPPITATFNCSLVI